MCNFDCDNKQRAISTRARFFHSKIPFCSGQNRAVNLCSKPHSFKKLSKSPLKNSSALALVNILILVDFWFSQRYLISLNGSKAAFIRFKNLTAH